MKNLYIRICALLCAAAFYTPASAGISAFIYGWSKWAMVVKRVGDDRPSVTTYYSRPETASNGVEYFRAGTLRIGDVFTPLRYGMRLADRKIYVYDFDDQREMTAFDFNLSAGDTFTTVNGMEWVVKEASDTLISSPTEEYERMHRLLRVESTDGRWSDQWLEDFGSFTSHLMVTDMADVECSQTPWAYLMKKEKDSNFYLDFHIAREFSCDPFFGHDTGRLTANYDNIYHNDRLEENDRKDIGTVAYEDGRLTFSRLTICIAKNRCYHLYYRAGDDIYLLDGWVFEPIWDGSNWFWHQDTVIFSGLPEPTSGSYTLHDGDKEYSTDGIGHVKAGIAGTAVRYDLQGRKLDTHQTPHGIVISDGMKMLCK